MKGSIYPNQFNYCDCAGTQVFRYWGIPKKAVNTLVNSKHLFVVIKYLGLLVWKKRDCKAIVSFGHLTLSAAGIIITYSNNVNISDFEYLSVNIGIPLTC